MLKLRKMLSLVMVLSLIAGWIPAAAAASEFSDMPAAGVWSAEALKAAVDEGLLNGSGGKLLPKDPLRRAQMAAILNRAFGSFAKADIAGFTDVPSGAWYRADIEKAVQMGTFEGDGSGKMRPDAPITRQEAFVVLARALALPDGDAGVLNRFSDKALIAPWAVGPLAALAGNGYIQGSGGKLRPLDTISREEFAQLVYNCIENYIKVPGTVKSVGSGNVVLRVGGVTLQDLTIDGDLILGEGVALESVKLLNVTVKGRILVRGGGSLEVSGDTSAQELVVFKTDETALNVSVERTADVGMLEIRSDLTTVVAPMSVVKVASGVSGTFVGGSAVDGGQTVRPVTEVLTPPGGGTFNIATTAIDLSPAALSVQIGSGSTELSAVRTPANANDTLTWSSTNPSVATVSSTGRISAIGFGETAITVETPSGLFASIPLYVTMPEDDTSFTVTEPGTVINGGQFVDITIAESVGIGNFTLNGVTVTGRLIVRGGGANSGHIHGGSIASAQIESTPAGGTRLVFGGGATVDTLSTESGTDVLIEGAPGETAVIGTLNADGTTEVQDANIQTIVNTGSLSLNSVTATSITCDGSTTLDLSPDVTVGTLTTSGSGTTQIDGNGTIPVIQMGSSGLEVGSGIGVGKIEEPVRLKNVANLQDLVNPFLDLMGQIGSVNGHQWDVSLSGSGSTSLSGSFSSLSVGGSAGAILENGSSVAGGIGLVAGPGASPSLSTLPGCTIGGPISTSGTGTIGQIQFGGGSPSLNIGEGVQTGTVFVSGDSSPTIQGSGQIGTFVSTSSGVSTVNTPSNQILSSSAGTIKGNQAENATTVAVALDHIEVTTLPTQVRYTTTATALNPDGMVVTAYYNVPGYVGLISKPVTGWMQSWMSGVKTPGAHTITVTYMEGAATKTATFEVEIVERTVGSIHLFPVGNMRPFEVNKAVDLTGYRLIVSYAPQDLYRLDFIELPNPDVTPEPATFTSEGGQTLTVHYGGKSTTISVYVRDPVKEYLRSQIAVESRLMQITYTQMSQGIYSTENRQLLSSIYIRALNAIKEAANLDALSLIVTEARSELNAVQTIEQSALADANHFKTIFADVLAFTVETVQASSWPRISEVLVAYNTLPDVVKAKLTEQYSLLTRLKQRTEELQAEINLTLAQAAATDALNAQYEKYAEGYSTHSEDITAAWDAGLTAIDAATSITALRTALVTAYTAMASYKSDAVLLAEHKTAKIQELDPWYPTGKTAADYNATGKTQIQVARDQGKAAIQQANSIEAVNTELANAKSAIGSVLTAAQMAAEALATAKTEAQNALNAAYAAYSSGYSTNASAISSAKSAGLSAISAAPSIAAVQTAKENAIQAMAAYKSDAVLLSDHKAAKVLELNAYYPSGKTFADYNSSGLTAIQKARTQGAAAIAGAASTSAVNTTLAEAKAVIDAVKTAVQMDAAELAAAKTAATDALTAAYNDYATGYATNYAAITAAKTTGLDAITAATTLNAVAIARNTAISAMAAFKSDVVLLSEHKAEKILELDAYYPSGKTALDYNQAGTDAIVSARTQGTTAINGAASIAAVDTALAGAKSVIDAVKTIAQLDAEALDAAKVLAVGVLETAFGSYATGYATNLAAITAAKDAGLSAISTATTPSAVTAATDAAISAMAEFKSDAVLLREYKAAKILELDAYYPSGKTALDYNQAGTDAIASARTQGTTAINGAASNSAVDTALAGAKGVIDAVKTVAQIAAELAAAKNLAQDALETAFDSYATGYATNLAAITAAKDAGLSAISTAATLAEVADAQDAAISAMAAYKSDAVLLSEYKAEKIPELDTYYPSGKTALDYNQAGTDAIASARTQGTTAINSAASIAAVDTALAGAKSVIDAVKTIAQLDAEALDAAKVLAVGVLETAFDSYATGYATNLAAITAAKDAGLSAISTATTPSAVADAQDTAISAMAAYKSDAMLFEEYRVAALTALSEYFRTGKSAADYDGDTLREIDQIKAACETEIQGAASIEEIETALNVAKASIDQFLTLDEVAIVSSMDDFNKALNNPAILHIVTTGWIDVDEALTITKPVTVNGGLGLHNLVTFSDSLTVYKELQVGDGAELVLEGATHFGGARLSNYGKIYAETLDIAMTDVENQGQIHVSDLTLDNGARFFNGSGREFLGYVRILDGGSFTLHGENGARFKNQSSSVLLIPASATIDNKLNSGEEIALMSEVSFFHNDGVLLNNSEDALVTTGAGVVGTYARVETLTEFNAALADPSHAAIFVDGDLALAEDTSIDKLVWVSEGATLTVPGSVTVHLLGEIRTSSTLNDPEPFAVTQEPGTVYTLGYGAIRVEGILDNGGTILLESANFLHSNIQIMYNNSGLLIGAPKGNGLIKNSGRIELKATEGNGGTLAIDGLQFRNLAGGEVYNKNFISLQDGDFLNEIGARLINEGAINIQGGCTLSNNGAISNFGWIGGSSLILGTDSEVSYIGIPPIGEGKLDIRAMVLDEEGLRAAATNSNITSIIIERFLPPDMVPADEERTIILHDSDPIELNAELIIPSYSNDYPLILRLDSGTSLTLNNYARVEGTLEVAVGAELTINAPMEIIGKTDNRTFFGKLLNAGTVTLSAGNEINCYGDLSTTGSFSNLGSIKSYISTGSTTGTVSGTINDNQPVQIMIASSQADLVTAMGDPSVDQIEVRGVIELTSDLDLTKSTNIASGWDEEAQDLANQLIVKAGTTLTVSTDLNVFGKLVIEGASEDPGVLVIADSGVEMQHMLNVFEYVVNNGRIQNHGLIHLFRGELDSSSGFIDNTGGQIEELGGGARTDDRNPDVFTGNPIKRYANRIDFAIRLYEKLTPYGVFEEPTEDDITLYAGRQYTDWHEVAREEWLLQGVAWALKNGLWTSSGDKLDPFSHITYAETLPALQAAATALGVLYPEGSALQILFGQLNSDALIIATEEERGEAPNTYRGSDFSELIEGFVVALGFDRVQVMTENDLIEADGKSYVQEITITADIHLTQDLTLGNGNSFVRIFVQGAGDGKTAATLTVNSGVTLTVLENTELIVEGQLVNDGNIEALGGVRPQDGENYEDHITGNRIHEYIDLIGFASMLYERIAPYGLGVPTPEEIDAYRETDGWPDNNDNRAAAFAFIVKHADLQKITDGPKTYWDTYTRITYGKALDILGTVYGVLKDDANMPNTVQLDGSEPDYWLDWANDDPNKLINKFSDALGLDRVQVTNENDLIAAAGKSYVQEITITADIHLTQDLTLGNGNSFVRIFVQGAGDGKTAATLTVNSGVTLTVLDNTELIVEGQLDNKGTVKAFGGIRPQDGENFEDHIIGNRIHEYIDLIGFASMLYERIAPYGLGEPTAQEIDGNKTIDGWPDNNDNRAAAFAFIVKHAGLQPITDGPKTYWDAYTRITYGKALDILRTVYGVLKDNAIMPPEVQLVGSEPQSPLDWANDDPNQLIKKFSDALGPVTDSTTTAIIVSDETNGFRQFNNIRFTNAITITSDFVDGDPNRSGNARFENCVFDAGLTILYPGKTFQVDLSGSSVAAGFGVTVIPDSTVFPDGYDPIEPIKDQNRVDISNANGIAVTSTEVPVGLQTDTLGATLKLNSLTATAAALASLAGHNGAGPGDNPRTWMGLSFHFDSWDGGTRTVKLYDVHPDPNTTAVVTSTGFDGILTLFGTTDVSGVTLTGGGEIQLPTWDVNVNALIGSQTVKVVGDQSENYSVRVTAEDGAVVHCAPQHLVLLNGLDVGIPHVFQDNEGIKIYIGTGDASKLSFTVEQIEGHGDAEQITELQSFTATPIDINSDQVFDKIHLSQSEGSNWITNPGQVRLRIHYKYDTNDTTKEIQLVYGLLENRVPNLPIEFPPNESLPNESLPNE